MTTSNSSILYVPLRDEDTISRSMSINERIFLRSCAHAGSSSSSSILRMDGRSAGESRSLRLSFSRNHNGSECTVHAASSSSTQVTCSVYGQVIPCPKPYDQPNHGVVLFQVDASPMACIGWESSSSSSGVMDGESTSSTSSSATTKLFCNRIQRNLERNILIGGVLDVESLCIVSGKWVWRLVVSVIILDHGGNCLDMAMLATMAALRHYRRPHVDILSTATTATTAKNDYNLPRNMDDDEVEQGDQEILEQDDLMIQPTISSGIQVIHSDDREPTPLPLHHTPLLVSFALFSDPTASSSTIAALLDPSFREEMLQNGTITFGYNKYGEMTCLDFPGGCEMHPRQMIACAELGKKKCIELCNLLEGILVSAEEKAEQDRMDRSRRYQQQQQVHQDIPSILLPPLDELLEYNAMESNTDTVITDTTIVQKNTNDQGNGKEDEEEEMYRRQALDYSIGHVAVKVKDDVATKPKGSSTTQNKKGGSLLEAMMKSATLASKPQPNNNTME